MNGGSGRCLCGAVRFRFEGAPNWQAHCHCESCRRNCAAPFTSYLGVTHGQWEWTGTVPAVFGSTPGVKRHFCATCGTPMAYESDAWAHEIHFYAATLDDPASYEPTLHVHWDEHLPWVRLADGLPVHRTPQRLRSGADFGPLLAFLRTAFRFMEGRIDPPSSIERMDVVDFEMLAAGGEIWIAEEEKGEIAAAMVLTLKKDHLYLGKLAVLERLRGQGIARQFVRLAWARAKELNLPEVRLQTRVELTENQAAFTAMGFREIGRSAHPGYTRPTSVEFAMEV